MIVLLIVACISFILGQFGRIQLDNAVAFTLLDISVGLVFVGHSIKKIREGSFLKVTWDKTTLAAIGFIGVGLLSLLLNSSQLESSELLTAFLYLLRFVLYGSIYFIVRDLTQKEKGLVMVGQIVVGVAIILIGFVQYFYYPFLRNLYYLGWDDHLFRLFSTFLDPNFAGSFFVLLFLFILGFFTQVFQKRMTKASIGYGILLLLTLLAIFLTYSRTAFLMLIVGTGVFFLIKKQWKVLLGGILLFIVTFSLFANTKYEGLNPFRTASSLSRIETAQNAITIFTAYPVLGVGFNAYRYAQLEMGYKEDTTIPNHASAGTDNVYLFVLATTGIIGFSAFLLFFFLVLKRLIQGLAKKDIIHEVLFSSLIAVLCGSLFNNLLFYPAILLWLVLLGGLIPRE